MNISEINQRNLSLLDVNQLKAFLDIFKGVSNPKAKVVIKDLTRELGTRKMEAVEEASVKDIIKAVKAAAKKIGGIIDKVFDDKGFQDAYAKYVDNPKDKNRLKKIQDYTNGMLGNVSEEAYDSDKKHTMDPKSHVQLNKETGMYCVYNAKSEKVSEFESKKDAEEYAVKNHDELMKESTDLEEAALPFKELEKAWIRTKGNDKKREKLIKKHKLKPLISNVRQGSIKLGPMNDLKAKNGNHTMAGLDADGELIFISNNPVRIHYPSNTKDRPRGDEMKESLSLDTLRLRKVIELSVNESDKKTIDSFIAESNVDITWAPSKISKTFNKFTRGL
jgi:hypothetical protein